MAAPKGNPFKSGTRWNREAVLEYISERFATSSLGLKLILDSSEHKMPVMSTVQLWISTDEQLSGIYARGKVKQADYMAEEILSIADDATNDYMAVMNADGSERDVLNSEHVQRSRLRIDSRKWLMSKLIPKKYGDRLALDGKISQRTTVKIIDLSGKKPAKVEKAKK